MRIPAPQRPFPSHVRDALSKGELWRAKEILQGTLANSKYDPLLYEQYGIVLLQMNDLVEAGKYLFLSGQVKEGYEKSLTLYLEKFGRRDWQTLVASFPKKAKNIQLNLYPANVQEELRKLQIPANKGNELVAPPVTTPGWFSDTFLYLTVGCGCVLIILCLFLGALSLLNIVSRWF